MKCGNIKSVPVAQYCNIATEGMGTWGAQCTMHVHCFKKLDVFRSKSLGVAWTM